MCCLSLHTKVKSVAVREFDSSFNKDIRPIGFCKMKIKVHLSTDMSIQLNVQDWSTKIQRSSLSLTLVILLKISQ